MRRIANSIWGWILVAAGLLVSAALLCPWLLVVAAFMLVAAAMVLGFMVAGVLNALVMCPIMLIRQRMMHRE